MLPLPKLDDRSFEDIRLEAIRNITKYCPEWTNHNISDPGITLVELFSAMSEMTNYRLNRVPEKNYIAFLDMIGVVPRYPIGATSRVLFGISDNYEYDTQEKSPIRIPQYTILSTNDDEPILFETLEEHNIFNLKFSDVFSKTYDNKADKSYITTHIDKIKNQEAFLPFEQKIKEASQIAIYIYSSELSSLKNHSKTTIIFRLPTSIEHFNYNNEIDFLKKQQWQYYNGEWCELNILDVNIKVDDKDAHILQVSFDGENDITEENFENFGKNFYIRCIFKEAHIWFKNFSLYEISIASNSKDDGIVPDGCYYRGLELDLNSDILPFGEEPNINENISEEIFYIKCDEAFCKQNTRVKISFMHSQNNTYDKSIGYSLQINWYYTSGNKEFNDLNLIQNTINNFTKNGIIEFDTPKNFKKSIINGIEGYWLKAKIITGNYGSKQEVTYDSDGQIDRVKSTQTLKPPKLRSVKINYSQDRIDLKNAISYNNYTYEKLTFQSHIATSLFKENFTKENALYFQFNSYISDTYFNIYFDIGKIEKLNLNAKERVISWEILKNSEWVKLVYEDDTDYLTKSGEIRFIIPNMERLEIFEVDNHKRDGMWIRAVVNFSTLQNMLPIQKVLLNTIQVAQQETIYDENLGTSIGLPYIKLKLNYQNLTKAPIIYVGDDEYKVTKRFIDNDANSKIFRFNPVVGEIEFGDNKYGKIPTLNEKIYAKKYSITQGSKGNIPKCKINTLRTSISYVESVTNIVDASGGRDGDDIESIKKYAPSIFKSRDRAVTQEDYEAIAKEYSSSIIDVKCINKSTHIQIVLATKDLFDKDGFINRKLIYDLEKVLQEKSLITVVVKVTEAKKYSLSAKVKIKNSSERVLFQKDIASKINSIAKDYFSVQKGFGIGKNVTKADFYKILNKVDTNLYYDEISILKNNTSIGDKLLVGLDEVAFFDTIIIEEFNNE